MTSQKQACTKRNIFFSQHAPICQRNEAVIRSRQAFLCGMMALLFLFVGTAHSIAQLSTATAFGNVTDSTGAAVSGATIALPKPRPTLSVPSPPTAKGNIAPNFCRWGRMPLR